MDHKLSNIALAKLASWISNVTCKELSLSDCYELNQLTTIHTQSEEQKNDYVNSNLVDDLLEQLLNGQKIDAIRSYRMLTGKTLKESSDVIEKYRPKPKNT